MRPGSARVRRPGVLGRRPSSSSSSSSTNSSSSSSKSMVGLAAARQLALQGGEVGVRGVVLQLPGHLRLLGLSTAAPHGSTPSHRIRGSPKAGPDDVRHLSWLLRYMASRFGTRPSAPRVALLTPTGRVARKSAATVPVVSGAAITAQPRWIVRSRPTSAIRRSASRSAATAGGTPSASASRRICRGGVEDPGRAQLGPLEVEALDLVGHLDHAARVDHVVGRVEDAALGEQLLDAGVGELVVGARRRRSWRAAPARCRR